MRRIEPHQLWVGHGGDAAKPRALAAAGIRAMVDLAVNEPPAIVSREMVYCRFPLIDGAGNAPEVLRLAVGIVTGLLNENVPTLVFCGAGMSRSPSIAAAAIAKVTQQPPGKCLAMVIAGGPHDVSGALWQDVVACQKPGDASA